jgi:hypothetical protein
MKNKMVDMQLSNSKLVIVAQNDNGRNFVTYEQAAALLSTHGVQNS